MVKPVVAKGKPSKDVGGAKKPPKEAPSKDVGGAKVKRKGD